MVPKLIIYIGMPLAQARPREAWLAANLASFKRGYILASLRTRMKTFYYGIRQPKRNINIIRMAKAARPVILPKAAAVFIINQHDPWPKSEELQQYIDVRDWEFINMPGTHDDVW